MVCRRFATASRFGLLVICLALLGGCGLPRVRGDGSEHGFDHLVIGVPF